MIFERDSYSCSLCGKGVSDTKRFHAFISKKYLLVVLCGTCYDAMRSEMESRGKCTISAPNCKIPKLQRCGTCEKRLSPIGSRKRAYNISLPVGKLKQYQAVCLACATRDEANRFINIHPVTAGVKRHIEKECVTLVAIKDIYHHLDKNFPGISVAIATMKEALHMIRTHDIRVITGARLRGTVFHPWFKVIFFTYEPSEDDESIKEIVLSRINTKVRIVGGVYASYEIDGEKT